MVGGVSSRMTEQAGCMVMSENLSESLVNKLEAKFGLNIHFMQTRLKQTKAFCQPFSIIKAIIDNVELHLFALIVPYLVSRDIIY